MKIEIELEEVEALRKELAKYIQLYEHTNKQLSELSEWKLIERAISLSQDLTDKCLQKIFSELGFNEAQNVIKFGMRMRDDSGKYWWDSDNTEIVLGAIATTKMKEAFLKIGFITSEKTAKSSEIKLPD